MNQAKLMAFFIVSLLTALAAVSFFFTPKLHPVFAQKKPTVTITNSITPIATETAQLATDSANIASPSAEELALIAQRQKEDITKPEEPPEKIAYLKLFSKRPITNPNILNIFGYTVQQAVKVGVPVNTIILILILPLLATIIVFLHHIVGIPVYNILVPVAFSITLVATGPVVGLLLLTVIVIASVLARILLKRVRIMHMPKLALSLFIVSLSVFFALFFGAYYGLIAVKTLSIFPVLLLILLSERIVSIQLVRNRRDTVLLTSTILGIGIFGYLLLTYEPMQNTLLLYPELLLLLLPINIIIGRYFGLRFTELYRFRELLTRYGR